MPNVYVVNNRHHDFTSAQRFGTLVSLTEGTVPIFKTDAVVADLHEKLQTFNHDEDYILISGPALLNALACMVLQNDKPIKMLIFDAKAQEYVARHVSAFRRFQPGRMTGKQELINAHKGECIIPLSQIKK
ncbi:hypothetical protein D3C75_333090 [compost metagenome]